MKIVLVDQKLTGHHIQYIRGLMSADTQNTYICVLPEQLAKMNYCEQIVIEPPKRTLSGYFSYLKKLKSAIAAVDPDVVHLLYGDYFYRFFGFLLNWAIPKKKLIATLHSIPGSFIKKMGVRAVYKRLHTGVVHTEKLRKQLDDTGVKNVTVVEYPCFLPVNAISAEQAKMELGLKLEVPVIAALGGTRYDKGLDLLLKALRGVTKPFQILIAGREQEITKEQIAELTSEYQECTHVILKDLPDEEYCRCVKAADYVVLPYRKILTGASGPLVEGVAAGKTIIGTDFGSIGQIIQKRHIGYLWDTDSVTHMTQILEQALTAQPMVYDDVAREYRDSVSVERFSKAYMRLYEEMQGEI